MSDETWAPVVNYEGLYEASSAGFVRSLDRLVPGRDGSTRRIAGQTLTPRVRPGGTVAVNLWADNIYTQVALGFVVLEAFDGPPPEGVKRVLNVNGDPADCRLPNLEWQLPVIQADRPNAEDRFWSKVIAGRREPQMDTPCLVWSASTVNGYGKFHYPVMTKCAYAHRVAWLWEYGSVPAWLGHACHNPRCVRVDHLRPRA